MLYKNIKTGAVHNFESVILSPDWNLLDEKAGSKAPKEAPKEEPPKAAAKKSTSASEKRARK